MIKNIISIMALLVLGLNAKNLNFILANDSNLLIPKTVNIINQTSNELFSKTGGYGLYVSAIDSIKDADSILKGKALRDYFISLMLKDLKPPYAVIFFFLKDKKIIIKTSTTPPFSEKEIYFEYMAPLLPMGDEPLTPQNISAVVLNGYGEIAQRVAESYGVRLSSEIAIDNSGAKTWIRMILYFMLFSTIALLGVNYLISKRRAK